MAFNDAANATVPIRPAASVIIAAKTRQGTGKGSDYKILMLKRNNRGQFGSLHVFPGGRVDHFDQDPRWLDILPKSMIEQHKKTSKIPLAFRIAAVRETFEESGVQLFDPPLKLSLEEAEKWRSKVHRSAKNFLELCEMTSSAPDITRIVHFACWVTPKGAPKRFNTHFFIAVMPSSRAPEGARYAADGKETLEMAWLTPNEALARFRRYELNIISPQFVNLSELSRLSYDDLNNLVLSGGERQGIVRMAGEERGRSESGRLLVELLPGDEEHSESKDVKVKPGSRNRINSIFKTKDPNEKPDLEWEINIDLNEYSKRQERTAGLGLETATELCKLGAHVIITSRNDTRGKEAVARICDASGSRKVEYGVMENSSLRSADMFAQWFLSKNIKLYGLICNAGVGGNPNRPQKGIDETLIINHLSHFHLSRLLLDNLLQTKGSRLVNVSSEMGSFTFGRPDWTMMGRKEYYNSQYAYQLSKLANQLFTRELVRQLGPRANLYVNCVHPGVVNSTIWDKTRSNSDSLYNIITTSFMKFTSVSTQVGAMNQLFAATSPLIETDNIRGEYFVPILRKARVQRWARNDEVAKELWQFSLKAVDNLLKNE
ncbi:hypothetical protein SmJEL517_g00026 [Synchytrium microbalum]|uniref:Nudix hydrolase domain-containing protein n=1 Tax=Synchytrium microbalum TaxID=1806994 RepID=A0A507CJT2_9FUNG|nr:uncharacterized protein SmJEL517_g00026 [Synchytrium microbalum]TPX38033.1 hypothetical protein SmJEL517_g00026 [Synchytrium microbalum]